MLLTLRAGRPLVSTRIMYNNFMTLFTFETLPTAAARVQTRVWSCGIL
jgi:hypothetical protein